jgi:hypothetical protein
MLPTPLPRPRALARFLLRTAVRRLERTERRLWRMLERPHRYTDDEETMAWEKRVQGAAALSDRLAGMRKRLAALEEQERERHDDQHHGKAGPEP